MADPCPSSTTLAVAGSSLSEDSALGPERSLVGSTSEGASDTKTCLEPQALAVLLQTNPDLTAHPSGSSASVLTDANGDVTGFPASRESDLATRPSKLADNLNHKESLAGPSIKQESISEPLSSLLSTTPQQLFTEQLAPPIVAVQGQVAMEQQDAAAAGQNNIGHVSAIACGGDGVLVQPLESATASSFPMPIVTCTVATHGGAGSQGASPPQSYGSMLNFPAMALASDSGMLYDEDGESSEDDGDAENDLSEGEDEEMDMDTESAADGVATGGGEDDDDDDDDNDSLSNLAGGDGISQLLQAAEMTPGIEMLAAAAQNATPAGFPCPHCNKTYPMASGLRRHIKRSHNNTSNSSNGPFVSAGLHAEKRLSKCSFCQADLPQPATQAVRRQHMRGECTKNPYACRECDKVFVSPGGLQRHSLLHNGKRPFQCTICNKEFTQASHLKVHMNGHTGEKPYQCDHEDCDKTYSDPSSLRSHKLAHAGIKAKKKRNPDAPYLANPKCAYCDKRFVSRASRDQHARECGSNPYRCMICQKACLGMVKLERHIRSHSRSRVSSLKAQEMAKNKKTQSPDPKCAYCVERFPTRVVRDRHSRMCTNNPYRCNLCYKAFLGSAKLLRHARSHAESGSHAPDAVAAAIKHATSLASAGPGPASPTSVQESAAAQPTPDTANASVTGDGSNCASSVQTFGGGGSDSTTGISSVSSAAELSALPTPQLPVLTPTSSSLANIVMPAGNHPLIALPTLGYSYMPSSLFQHMGQQLPLIATSQQQLGQNSLQQIAQASAAGDPSGMLSAGISSQVQLAAGSSSVQKPSTQHGAMPSASVATSDSKVSDESNSEAATTSGVVAGQGALTNMASTTSRSGTVLPVASGIKQEAPGPDSNISYQSPIVGNVSALGGAQTSDPGIASSQPHQPMQAATYLTSLPPFSFPLPFPSATGIRSPISNGTPAQAGDSVQSILQAILGSVDLLGVQSQLQAQPPAVLQQIQQALQMQAGLLSSQQQQQHTATTFQVERNPPTQPATVATAIRVKQEEDNVPLSSGGNASDTTADGSRATEVAAGQPANLPPAGVVGSDVAAGDSTSLS